MATHLGSSECDIFTDPTIQEFEDWIQDHKCPGVIFKPESTEATQFVPDKAIQEYFDCSRDTNHARIKKLVEAATRPSAGPVNAKAVAESCPRIFTILVLIGYSRFISSFVRNARLHDRRLPFRAGEAPLFPKLEGGITFFENFNAHQWCFCVESLGQSLSLEPVQFDDSIILPFVPVGKLDKGTSNSAVVHKISVHEDYDDLEILEEDEELRSLQESHVYVVKSYHRLDAERYFYAEAHAFRKFNESGQPVPNLIGFHGAFKQNGSFNIVLQYANIGTLEDYFKKTNPPKREKDVISLWRNLFRLADALADIHHLPQDSDTRQPRIFQGWYQDIRPANIFVAGSLERNPYGVQFMLADRGLGHFKATVDNHAGPTGEDIGGARAYSAPEMYKPRGAISDFKIQVKQKTDIWSLACVYSEVNAWVVEGINGVNGLENYRTQRQENTEALGDAMGSCFHNRKGEVLELVSSWHANLSSLRVAQDHVTPIIWDELLRHMFLPNIRRLSALQVQGFSDIVLHTVKKFPRIQVAPSETASPSTAPTRSPPRTPPEIPPEHQGANRHCQDVRLSNHLPTSQKSSSPPHAPNDRETMVLMDETRDLTMGKEPGWKGMHSPTKTDPVEHTSLATWQTKAGGHDSERMRYSMQEPIYVQANSINAPREMMTGWSAQLLGRSERAFDTGLQNHDLPNPENTKKCDFPPAVADLPSEAEFEGKEKIIKESQRTKTLPSRSPKEMSASDLGRWVEMTKASSTIWGTKEYSLPYEDELLGELRERDYMFIVDDAKSMSSHWPEVQSLFADLIYMVKKKKLGPNGSELRFIMSDEHKEAKHTSDLILMVRQMRMRLKGNTNFALRLDDVFETYKEKLARRGDARPISLFVLTNGIWQPGNGQLNMVASSIKRMVEHLESMGATSKKVGIQFIRFGNDQEGVRRLEWLNSKLKHEWNIARDICDTTDAAGNVWKMLLGSINDYWDGDPDD